MKHSDELDKIAPAFAKAQAALKPAIKDSVNPHFKSRYADLAAVWDACRDALKSNDLFVTQELESLGAGIAVTTRVMHTSGQWMEFGPLGIPMTKTDAHSAGSAAMYGRRYSLSAALGIVAEEDDDANAAAEEAKPKKAKEPRQETPPTPEPPKAPDVPLVSEEQSEAIRHAAKEAGVKTMGEFKAALLRFAGTENASHVQADRYQHVMEQFDLMKAPA